MKIAETRQCNLRTTTQFKGMVLLALTASVFCLFSEQVGLTRAQLIALLPVSLGTCIVTGASLKNRWMLMGVALSLVASLIFVLSPNQSSESIAVASLSEDPTGAHTRSLRVGIIESSAKRVGARTLSNRLGKLEKRERLLEREPNITVIVFGSVKWLEVATSGVLKELKVEGAANKTLWISRQLPEFGINPAPPPQTAKFLGELALALGLGSEDPARQTALRALGELAAPWRSQTHRAAPWILLAGDQVERFVRMNQTAKQEQELAVKEIRYSLDRAAHFSPPRFGPRLALTARHIKSCLLTAQALRANSPSLTKAAILANKRILGVLKGKPRSTWRFNIAKAAKRNIGTLQQ